MGKHKLIHKNYEQRAERPLSRQKTHDNSSSDDDQDDLKEVDCNRFLFAEEEDYSVEEQDSWDGQEAPLQHPEECDFSYSYSYSTGEVDLQQVNATYLRLMSSDGDSTAERQVKIAVDIEVKFFDLQRPAAEIHDIEEYLLPTFQQHQQNDPFAEEESL